tara:strand:+ start:17731 stop:18402 length:672 start_codon:yes stop_codon:yes gene_type:complete
MRPSAFCHNHYVVTDIETTSLNQTTQILSIGAVVVSLEKGVLPHRFYMPIKCDIDYRFALPTQEVAEFWNSLDAKESLSSKVWIDPRAKSLREALLAYKAFLSQFSDHKHRILVGKGTRFDGGALHHAFEVEGMDFPFYYWAESCLRALFDQAAVIRNPLPQQQAPGVYHHALFDAHFEAKQFLYLMNLTLQLGIDELVERTWQSDVMDEQWAIDEVKFLESI